MIPTATLAQSFCRPSLQPSVKGAAQLAGPAYKMFWRESHFQLLQVQPLY